MNQTLAAPAIPPFNASDPAASISAAVRVPSRRIPESQRIDGKIGVSRVQEELRGSIEYSIATSSVSDLSSEKGGRF